MPKLLVGSVLVAGHRAISLLCAKATNTAVCLKDDAVANRCECVNHFAMEGLDQKLFISMNHIRVHFSPRKFSK